MADSPSSQALTARLNKPLKLALGIITVIPAVYLIAFLIWGFIKLVTITPGAIADTAIITLFQIFFALNGISVVITLVMEVFYLIDSTQNGSVPKDQRVVWTLILLFMGIFTMPVYWYRFVWIPSHRQSASIAGGNGG